MKIHLLGDSLVQTRQARHSKFFCGWGDMLHGFFNDETEILNYAMGGRSSRSFLNEGRFYDNGRFTTEKPPYGMGPALPRIAEGDYVFIQFMCNDDDSAGCAYRVNKHVTLGEPDENGIYPTAVPTPSMLSSPANWRDGYAEALQGEGKAPEQIATILETTKELIELCGEKYFPFDCGATYKGYLKFYIDTCREKGAIPVLVISGAKHFFTDGKIQPIPGYHGGRDAYHDFPYVQAVKQLGEALSVPVLDLFAPEKYLYEALGAEKACYLHNLSVQTGDVQDIDATDQFGSGADTFDWLTEFDRRWAEKDFLRLDGTHKNHFGAFLQAAILADGLYDRDMLRDCIRTVPSVFPGIPEKIKEDAALLASVCKHVRIFG